MRLKKTLKNSLYGIISYAILLLLGLLIRKAFLLSLPIEILGYEGLFGDLFAIISLADLGIETVILYRLFPAFSHGDSKEIYLLMTVYKNIYRIVGIIILLIGLILIPFLRLIIPSENYNWSFVYAIYLIQLSMTLTSYFLAYKRILFKVSQLEYECTKVDTLGSMVFGFFRLLSLIVLKNYYLYLLCNLVNNLICNFWIAHKADKKFNFLCNYTTSKAEMKALHVYKDIKNNLIQKICGVIYGGTDSILLSVLVGISSVGLVANYNFLCGYVQKFLDKLLNPFLMAIGNYVYSDEKDGLKLFRMFDFISFILADIIVINYFCLLNPLIEFLFGEQFLLSQSFVAALCLNQYIGWNHHFICFYRGALGRYELDKNYIMAAAILNIVISICFSFPFGVSGIMLGTAIGHMGFWIGRVKVVYSLYVKESVIKYILRQMFRFIVFSLELAMTFLVCRGLDTSIMAILLRAVICIVLPSIINLIIFGRSEEAIFGFQYLKRIIILMIKNK